MLVLTFQIGRERLALDIRSVVKVVPRVQLQTLACSPDWLAGVFLHAGQVVPVLDLHRLLGAGDCPPHLSSRIILVPCEGARGGPAPPTPARLLGLLAAQVADLREIPTPSGGAHVPVTGPVDLGPIVADRDGILRLLELDRLLPESLQRQLTSARGVLPS